MGHCNAIHGHALDEGRAPAPEGRICAGLPGRPCRTRLSAWNPSPQCAICWERDTEARMARLDVTPWREPLIREARPAGLTAGQAHVLRVCAKSQADTALVAMIESLLGHGRPVALLAGLRHRGLLARDECDAWRTTDRGRDLLVRHDVAARGRRS